jgi:hypothetical protein
MAQSGRMLPAVDPKTLTSEPPSHLDTKDLWGEEDGLVRALHAAGWQGYVAIEGACAGGTGGRHALHHLGRDIPSHDDEVYMQGWVLLPIVTGSAVCF